MKKYLHQTRAVIRKLVFRQHWNSQPTYQERRITMALSICLVGMVSCTVNGFMAMAAGKWRLFIADIGIALILALILYGVYRLKKINSVAIASLTVLCLGLYFLYLFFSDQVRGTGLLWYLFYPLMVIFLLGHRPGAYVLLLAMVVLLLSNYFARATYGIEFLFKFFTVYTAVGALAYAIERVQAGTEAQLIINNKKLNSMIAERSAAEESLRESRERYRDLLETVMDWIWEVDLHGNFTYSSPQIKNILGLEPKEIVGRKPSDLVQPKYRFETDQLMKKYMFQKQPFTGLKGTFIHQQGHRVVLESNGVPFLDADGNVLGFRGVTRDITIRQEAEKEHTERKKLQGALELAGAVCHELNQPVMAINGYAEILMLKKDRYPEIINTLEKVLKQTERVEGITRKLMNITRYETQKYSGNETIVDIEKSSSTDGGVKSDPA